ncbi:MAG: TetR/AcrR family transcriptional regulator [Bacteroidota bacterium]
MIETIGLREQKSAKTKLDILEETIQITLQKPFKELHVEEVCERVGISKVTFFKYFPQKEDLLMYYLRVWCFKRAVELDREPKEGLEGLYFLFDKMSEELEHNKRLMLGVLAQLASQDRPQRPMPVKHEERMMLCPGLSKDDKVEILSIDQMLEKFVLEAILNKEITKTCNTKELSDLFMTMLFGTALNVHMQRLSPMKLVFRKNLGILIYSFR